MRLPWGRSDEGGQDVWEKCRIGTDFHWLRDVNEVAGADL